MTKIQYKKHLISKKHQTICVDALKINLKGHIPLQSAKFRHLGGGLNLHYQEFGGNKNFHSNIKVYFKGREVGRIDAHPKSNIIAPDTVLFEVKNNMFYRAGWTNQLKTVFDIMQLQFSHVNQIDIAVDVLDNDNTAFNFIHKLTRGTFRNLGRTVWTPTFEGHTPDGKPKIRNLNFGSRASDKFMRCYYKKQEIKVSNKFYIEEFWHKNGFKLENGGEVARFELVIKRKELQIYKDVANKYGELEYNTLENLENIEYLATLFNTGQNKYFEFVTSKDYNYHKGDASRCKKRTVVDLRNITSYLLVKIRSKATTMIWSAKVTAKTLYMLYCHTQEELIWRQIDDILQNYHLMGWFENSVERFYKEFEIKYKSKDFEYLNSYTTTPTFTQSKIYNITAGFNG